jgi:hypothetical protein
MSIKDSDYANLEARVAAQLSLEQEVAMRGYLPVWMDQMRGVRNTILGSAWGRICAAR